MNITSILLYSCRDASFWFVIFFGVIWYVVVYCDIVQWLLCSQCVVIWGNECNVFWYNVFWLRMYLYTHILREIKSLPNYLCNQVGSDFIIVYVFLLSLVGHWWVSGTVLTELELSTNTYHSTLVINEIQQRYYHNRKSN